MMFDMYLLEYAQCLLLDQGATFTGTTCSAALRLTAALRLAAALRSTAALRSSSLTLWLCLLLARPSQGAEPAVEGGGEVS